MGKLKQLSVSKQVLLAFGTLCVILAAIGALLFFSLRSIERSSREKLSYVVDEAELVAAASQNVGLMQAVIFRHVLASDPAEIKLHDQTIHEIDKANAQTLSSYQKFVDTEEEGRLYAKILNARKEYMELTEQLLALSRANEDAKAREFAVSWQVPAYEEYQATIKHMTGYVENEVRDIAATMDDRIARIRMVGDVFIIIAILIAIGTGFAFTGVARRLNGDNRTLQIEVTERAKAEQTLRLLNSAVEQAKESIVITNAELDLPGPQIVFVNPAFTKMTGYTADEAIGKTPRILQGPRTNHAVLSRLRQNLERGEVFEGEAINYRKDGKEFDLEWQIAPIRNTIGKVTHFVAIQRDITERKLAEVAVQQSQKRLRDLIDGVGPSMFVGLMTPQGILIECNRPALAAAGLKPEDVLGKPFDETHWWAHSPEIQRQLREAIARAARGEASRYDVQVRATENHLIDVDFSLQPLRDETGEVVFLVPSASDISARRLAENALRESNEKFHQLADSIADVFWMTSPDMQQMHYVSHAYEEIWGRSAARLYEHPQEWAEAILPEDRERVLTTFTGLAADEPSVSAEFRIARPNGDVRWILSRGFQVRDVAGNVIRITGIATDITERRRVEQELKEAKLAAALREGAQRYSFLAEAVPQIIFTTWPDGRLDYVNKAWFDFSGMTFNETKNWGWSAILHPDDLQSCIERWTRSFAAGENFEFEYRLKRASDGAYRWHLGRALPMRDDHGQILQWVGTCADIDDAKRSKETLQASNDELGLRVLERTSELHAAKEAAEAASRAKSEFLANMSHEIRTPMNGVIGMTSLLLDTSLTEQQHEFAETIQVSGEALLTIVNDILDFSKIEAGKLELETVDIDLAHVMRGTLELLRGTAKSKGLELRASIDPGVPTQLCGDGGRLRQVLINLIGNAIKFTPCGEVRLHISVDRQTEEMASLRFRITDTGIGINLETQARLFQAFTQADGSTTRRYGGTGLGLAICKQLVEKMHGEIGVESSAGAGSTFWFTVDLPKQSKGVTRIAPPETKEIILREKVEPDNDREPIRSHRVLIAEDNAVNQRVAMAQLKKLGYASDTVTNGLEVLEALDRIPYDIVLMDCQMPELDGYETTRQVRERAGHQPYIIAMTANAMQGDRELCLATGMDNYISKPMRIADLKSALSEAPNSDVGPVDATALENLCDLEEDAPGIVSELIDSFRESTPKLLSQAWNAFDKPRELSAIAHTIKGSCSNFGARPMEALCLQLEHLVPAGGSDAARDLVAAIEREFLNVSSALESHRSAQRGK